MYQRVDDGLPNRLHRVLPLVNSSSAFLDFRSHAGIAPNKGHGLLDHARVNEFGASIRFGKQPDHGPGTVDDLPTRSLADLTEGDAAPIDHVADEDGELLDLLEQRGLLPGATVEVLETRPLDGLLVVAVNGAEQVIGRPVAQKVVVEAEAQRSGSVEGWHGNRINKIGRAHV